MKNKNLFIIAAVIIAGFLIYGKFENSYHEKEIKTLENEIGIVQKKFDSAVIEKEKFKDSSLVYENLAQKVGEEADLLRAKAQKEKKAKEDALAALHNLPKEVIDSFFVKRYKDVVKANVDLQLDKNVGNEVVVELVEKDHLVGQLQTSEGLNNTLTTQVNTLQTSLSFSKSALVSADSAISARSKQFELQQKVSDLLKQDLKTAQKKAFWNKIKGTAVGIGLGLTVGILVGK
jgi:hypothetical protein